MEAAAADALPLYEVDPLKPEAERELTADLETGNFHEPNSDKPTERLYKIQNDIYHYYAGHFSNGNQVLMNSDGSEDDVPIFPLVEFDKDGNLLVVHITETSDFTPSVFTPGTISVKEFFVLDQWIGIKQLPEHYQEFLDAPQNATDEERLHYPKEIEGWRSSGEFVLWFSDDYYLNEEGELDSS